MEINENIKYTLEYKDTLRNFLKNNSNTLSGDVKNLILSSVDMCDDTVVLYKIIQQQFQINNQINAMIKDGELLPKKL